jgi:hypothetical protein
MPRNRAYGPFTAGPRSVSAPDITGAPSKAQPLAGKRTSSIAALAGEDAETPHVPGRALPMRPDWFTIGDRGHGVQFYSDDDVLVDLLSRHVGSALICGDAAVVVATRAHREALERQFRRRGFAVDVAAREGRYIALDADETLATFVSDGWPDSERFLARVAPVIDRATAAVGRSRARVAVFGEMVALLWARGNPAAALRVEELWNSLARTHAFSLCCGYPMKGFTSQGDAAAFMKICAQHSHVFPAERRTKSRSVQL